MEALDCERSSGCVLCERIGTNGTGRNVATVGGGVLAWSDVLIASSSELDTTNMEHASVSSTVLVIVDGV